MLDPKSLFSFLMSNPSEKDCIDYFEKVIWNGKPVSPFDPASKVYKCKDGRYKCKNTNRYFTIKSTTIFRKSRISLKKWFLTLFFFISRKKSISTYQLARDVEITQKSAWFVLQRLRYTFKSSIFKTMLDGVIEIDEVFVGGKNKNRHWNKKMPNSQGRSCKDKTPVWGAIKRGGILIAEAITDNKQSTLIPLIRDNIKAGSNIYSDELPAYKVLGKWFNHEIVNHKAKQYVNGKASTNSIESAWAPFKRMIYGVYHQVSKEHLPKYVDEFTFRFNTRKHTERERFDLALSLTVGKKLTYRELTSSSFI